MNKFIISGNLTKSPELLYSKAGKGYTKFTVAVQRPFDREKTDFFNCTCFGKQAENVAQYCDKGSKVIVEGQVNIDKKDDKYYTNILADRVEFIGSKVDGQGEAKQAPSKPKQTNNDDPFKRDGKPIDISDDDLPF